MRLGPLSRSIARCARTLSRHRLRGRFPGTPQPVPWRAAQPQGSDRVVRRVNDIRLRGQSMWNDVARRLMRGVVALAVLALPLTGVAAARNAGNDAGAGSVVASPLDP